jgi:hypothetical protein
MLKSYVNLCCEKVEESIDYPCLMINNNSGNIWLLIGEGKGTLVSLGKECGFCDQLGKNSEGLIMSSLVPFEGTVTLKK